MNKFKISLNIVFAILLLRCIESTNGNISTNECADCDIIFDPCTGPTNVTYAVNLTDVNLIEELKPGENPFPRIECLPQTHKLTGDVSDSICFQRPQCLLVINKLKYRDVRILRDLCKSCAVHCKCKIKQNPTLESIMGGESKTLNVENPNWKIVICLFTYVGSTQPSIVNSKLKLTV